MSNSTFDILPSLLSNIIILLNVSALVQHLMFFLYLTLHPLGHDCEEHPSTRLHSVHSLHSCSGMRVVDSSVCRLCWVVVTGLGDDIAGSEVVEWVG